MTSSEPTRNPREVEPNVSGRSLGVQIFYLILTIVEALLGIRFVLSLIGANKTADFVDFIYRVSNPLVRPFYGILSSDFVYGEGKARFDYEVLIAMIVYLLIAIILVKIISLGKRNVQP